VSKTAGILVAEMRAATRPMRRAARRSGSEFEALATRVEALSVALEAVTRRLDGTSEPASLPVDGGAGATEAALVAAVDAFARHLEKHGERLERVSADIAALGRRLDGERDGGRVAEPGTEEAAE
jgi:hypothetical protein